MEYLPRMAIFARVVELGAFSKAARELGLTASSVSQHIRALEGFLGATLLHRTTRKLSLTEAGSLFYQNCARVVTEAREAQQNIATLNNEPVGELRIAASSFMAANYLVPALEDFIKSNPKINVSLDVSDHNIDLVESRIDLALRVGSTAKYGDIHLTRLNAVLCAAPAYLETHQAIQTPADLHQHDFLLFTPHGEQSCVDLKNQSGDSVRVRLQPRVSANHARALHRLALQGHGIARLLQAKVQADIDSGQLVVVLPQWRLDSFTAYLTTRHRDETPLKVKKCIEHIQTYFSLHHPASVLGVVATSEGASEAAG